MSIRYITTGDEKAARGLLGEGRHQLSILKNAMTFQDLKQLQRITRFDDGTVIKCLSCFGQDVVNVYVPPMPPPPEKRKIVEVFYCWCTNYFTIGIITKVFGEYGEVGDYAGNYPDYCNVNDVAIKNYIGIRYEVYLCQGDKKVKYICLPSDFAKYKVDDKVIVFMRGVWDGTSLNEPEKRIPERKCKNNEFVKCIACEGTERKDRDGEEADGSFIILPLELEGINV